MNVLFVSMSGDSLSLAERVQREGHNVFFYIYEEKAQKIGDGIVQKPKCKLPIMTKKTRKVIKANVNVLLREVQPDFCVFDMVKMGEVADCIRTQNIPVFGASKWADVAELDRAYGYKLMKATDIRTPLTHMFTAGQHEKAAEFVQKTGKRYVYKPSGNIECSHTYVAKGTEDMIAMLQLWHNDKCEFELQEYVEGVEVSCEIWWNGISAHLHNWTMEEKKFMNDDVGPAMGCAGNVVAFLPSKSRLVREGVGKMERLLKKVQYRGPIDLNSIVNKDGLFGLEFTVRFGYDAVQTLLELYRGSLTQLLFAIATGSNEHGEYHSGYAIGVRVSIPPYPHTAENVPIGVPVIGTNSENLKHIWWGDVRAGSKYYESAGSDGNLGVVTARGSDVRECRRRVYRTINNLIIPQAQYRTDIGERVNEDVKRLKMWGYL